MITNMEENLSSLVAGKSEGAEANIMIANKVLHIQFYNDIIKLKIFVL